MPRGASDPDADFLADYESEIISLEEETEHKVSQTMSAIESAVEAWKAAGKKPPALRLKIVVLQEFYDKLVDWEKRSLQRQSENNLDARITRLREFVQICADYENESKKRVG